MTTPLRSEGRLASVWKPGAMGERLERWLGRLIQVTLALFLTPALLVVLVVGGMGAAVLGVARLFTVALHGPARWPQPPAGPPPLSSRGTFSH